MATNKTRPNKKRTSLFLSSDVLKASAKKAAKMGVSRGFYLEQLVRKDTGLPVAVAEAPEPSVFE